MKLATKHPTLLLVVGLVGLLLPFAATGSTVRADGPALIGGGSSFASPEIDNWRAETARSPFSFEINYQAAGSSFGRQQYITGDLDFAASDIPFQPSEIPALNGSGRSKFVYVPVSAGGLAFMFNMTDLDGKRVKQLNLTREAVCKMFTVPNFTWNDPEIANANPGVRLPSAPVQPIVRQDGSGTSYVFSEYCKTVTPGIWSAFVTLLQNESSLDPVFLQGGATSSWPSGWGITQSANGADNVAAAVANTINSITYNETGYADIYKLSVASVRNQAGVFTLPTEDAVSVALGYATPRLAGDGTQDGTFILDYDGPEATAYFPSTYSYIIAQTDGFPADKGNILARFLCYSITKGQRKDLLDKLKYARLSAPLVDLGRSKIEEIPGAPPWDQCRVDSAAPPPAATTIPPAAATTVPTTPSGGSGAGSGGGGTPTATTLAPGSQTPASGTTVTGATVVPSGSGGGSATPTTVGGGLSAGNSSGGGGAATGQTVVSVDPVTGETSFAPAETIASESGCVDPVTGLPADPSLCVGFVVVAAGAGDGSAAGASATATVAPAAVQYNPTIDDSSHGPELTKIVWWLVQGASVCAIGVALAGVRRRVL